MYENAVQPNTVKFTTLANLSFRDLFKKKIKKNCNLQCTKCTTFFLPNIAADFRF